MTTDQLIHAIVGGEHDAQLEAITNAIRVRKDALNLAKLYTFKEGDRIRLSKDCRPKYLAGQPGKVMKVEHGKVHIHLDRQIRRFSQDLTCPASIVERVA